MWFLHTISQVTETLDLLKWILNSSEDKWIEWDFEMRALEFSAEGFHEWSVAAVSDTSD